MFGDFIKNSAVLALPEFAGYCYGDEQSAIGDIYEKNKTDGGI